MLSIVIPLYNKEKQIGDTLRSVLAQTYQDFEIVIVDDGSTDNSIAEVKKLSDPRIRVISQENAGVSAARNTGISAAKGEYIALIDGDDVWKPEFLSTIISLIKKYPNCDVFASKYELHDVNGSVIPTIINNLPFSSEEGIISNYFEVASCSNPPICSSSVVASKHAFNSILGFPVGIKSGEDLLTWARLACRYQIAYSNKTLASCLVEGYKISEKPKRVPAEDDYVGRQLEALDKEFHTPFLKQYISLWHKMRSSSYMRLRLRRKSIKEALKGLKYNPTNYKLYIFIILNLLPRKLQPF